MAPLPPREQRHPFPRYHGLEYSNQDIVDFEERMRMEHRDGDGVVVFTSQAWGRVFETRGPLRDISTDGDFLGPPPSYTLIRDPVLRLCHRMMAHSIAGRSHAPEKIFVKLVDTWAWVPAGPARQEGDAGGVAEEAPVAPRGGDEDEEMPQAREVLDSMARDFSRFTTWTVTSLSRMMDRADVTYTRYSESPVEYQRRSVRQRTDGASTSAAPQQPDP
ncbi:hypothetical protein Tco_1479549 [Tanacetum coccineum]